MTKALFSLHESTFVRSKGPSCRESETVSNSLSTGTREPARDPIEHESLKARLNKQSAETGKTHGSKSSNTGHTALSFDEHRDTGFFASVDGSERSARENEKERKTFQDTAVATSIERESAKIERHNRGEISSRTILLGRVPNKPRVLAPPNLIYNSLLPRPPNHYSLIQPEYIHVTQSVTSTSPAHVDGSSEPAEILSAKTFVKNNVDSIDY